jgi:ABC-type polysaccharide/polyol phosphate transport system ATPase subunit
MVLASHHGGICRQWCNKAIWMERGEVRAFGDVEDILGAYEAKAAGLTA